MDGHRGGCDGQKGGKHILLILWTRKFVCIHVCIIFTPNLLWRIGLNLHISNSTSTSCSGPLLDAAVVFRRPTSLSITSSRSSSLDHQAKFVQTMFSPKLPLYMPPESMSLSRLCDEVARSFSYGLARRSIMQAGWKGVSTFHFNKNMLEHAVLAQAELQNITVDYESTL